MPKTVPMLAALLLIIYACSCRTIGSVYVLRKDARGIMDSGTRNQIIPLLYEDLDDAGYQFTIGRNEVTREGMYAILHKKKKEIVINVFTENKSAHTLQFICSHSVIYSPTDTFTAQHGRYRIEVLGYPTRITRYEEVKDTITLAPREQRRFSMVFAGNRNYSHRLFKRTNASDTLRFHLNLFGRTNSTILLGVW